MITENERDLYNEACDESYEDLETAQWLESLTPQEAEDLGL